MRIALINPVTWRSQGYHTIARKIPQLGLQVLAQLTPAPHTVEIIDEIFGFDASDSLVRRGRFDLVGITSYSSGATRAYEIAAQCRKEGIPCIMGGPHASALPDEAAHYFDSVAVGECDAIWPKILEDAANGRLQKRYEGSLSPVDMPGAGRAAQHLQPINGKYDVSSIQTSRGCPVGCEYCGVTKFNGAEIRRRNIDEIIDEWNSTIKPYIFVVDDNFFGVGPKHAEWAKELLRQIIKRGKRRLWFSQTTINMGDDEEGLQLAYKAGCRGMLVGFETFNRESLQNYHKGINRNNLGRYKELVDKFHRAGLSVFGAFIVGADEDDEQTVADTSVQSVKLGIDTIQITNLTPLPGTGLYDRFMREGRIFATDYPNDWERYTFVETVFNPKKMTSRQLDEAIYELRHLAAKTWWVWLRTLRSLWLTKSITSALFIHGMNTEWKRMAKVQQPKDAARLGYVPTENERTRKIRDAFRLSLSKYKSITNGPST
ncbi:MAG: B12-binding domain-containing radical SAM protein [Phycisphaerae bacterium]|nr:B12-binding domain-containing radical SAM protein [Phycisphaerae bacterium]